MSSDLMSIEDQQILDNTQRMRKFIVNDLTANGTKVPEDTSSRVTLMQALDGQDRQVLAKAKIKSDDKNGNIQAQVQAMALNLLKNVSNRQNPNAARTESLDVPMIDINIVPGETHVGTQVFTLDDIMKES